jgi:DNA polymerase-3 subunit delta'
MNDGPDPRETLLHPRHNPRLIGHGRAERALFAAWASGRLHHAWLIAGRKGIGKATLAYRFARFLFANPSPAVGSTPSDLAVAEDNPAFRHMAARSLADLLVIERVLDTRSKEKGKLVSEIRVEEARRAGEFFARTAAEGGWRVAIVDAADDLNASSANALLKVIEEPPARSLFLIVAHAPGRLLATIRSRCRRLDLEPLAPDAVEAVLRGLPGFEAREASALRAAIALSEGSPGRALGLLGSQAAKAYGEFERVVSMPARARNDDIDALAGRFAARGNGEDFPLFAGLMCDWVARRAVEEARAGRRFKARALAEAHAGIAHSLREAEGLNLDRRETLARALTMIAEIEVGTHDGPR